MKRFTVSVLPTAMRDVDANLRWIAARSESGAQSWHQAYLDTLGRLRDFAGTFAPAPESTDELNIREISFQTRRGRTFRLFFTITGSTVYVQHVRDAAQAELPGDSFESDPEN